MKHQKLFQSMIILLDYCSLGNPGLLSTSCSLAGSQHLQQQELSLEGRQILEQVGTKVYIQKGVITAVLGDFGIFSDLHITPLSLLWMVVLVVIVL